MPRGDRTGPMGTGRLMGRGAGYCAGYNTPGFRNNISGRAGRNGRRYGRWFFIAGLFPGCVYLCHRLKKRGRT